MLATHKQEEKRMRTLRILSVVVVSANLGTAALAAPPEVPTSPPYIVLSDNLDEPNGYGFCIDTMSLGLNDLMHSHTCKPAQEGAERNSNQHDVRFMYKADSMQIESYAFEGLCMQALLASGRDAVFALLECSNAPRQKFVYEQDDKTLRLEEDQAQCVGVVSETAPAGPWVARGLVLASCDELEDSLKQWTVVSE
jgi:hypothetical protein